MQSSNDNSDAFDEELPADLSADKARGPFDIRNKRKGPPKAKFWILIGLLIVLLLVVLIGVWSWVIGEISHGSEKVDESLVKADATLAVEPAADDSMAKRKAEKLRALEEEEEKKRKAEQSAQQASTTTVAPAGQPGTNKTVSTGRGGKEPPPGESPMQRKLGGGVMLTAEVNDVSGYQGASRGEPAPKNPAPGQLPSGAADLDGSEGLQALGGSPSRGNLNNLSGPDFKPTRATLAPPGDYLLGHGTYARCALYTEIITEQPGPVDCRLTEPLYSVNGSTVLAEAGAKLSGVQTVQMAQGRVRVFTTWNELDTTHGRAQLDSIGAGPMGASGTEAWIDNHYKERYGGAIVLSLFKDVMTAATNTTQPTSGSGGYTINNSEQNFESMAEKSLDNTLNIAPTGHVLPGTVITVIVARDVDFSSVYVNR